LTDKEGVSEEPETLSMQFAQMELMEEPLWSNEALMYEKEMSEAFSDPESW